MGSCLHSPLRAVHLPPFRPCQVVTATLCSLLLMTLEHAYRKGDQGTKSRTPSPASTLAATVRGALPRSIALVGNTAWGGAVCGVVLCVLFGLYVCVGGGWLRAGMLGTLGLGSSVQLALLCENGRHSAE